MPRITDDEAYAAYDSDPSAQAIESAQDFIRAEQASPARTPCIGKAMRMQQFMIANHITHWRAELRQVTFTPTNEWVQTYTDVLRPFYTRVALHQKLREQITMLNTKLIATTGNPDSDEFSSPTNCVYGIHRKYGRTLVEDKVRCIFLLTAKLRYAQIAHALHQLGGLSRTHRQTT